MGKSLTDTAKGILLKEDSTPNAATLKPGSKLKMPSPMHNDADDLGPAIVEPDKGYDLGAKSASKMSKDKSKSSQKGSGEPPKKLSEEDEQIQATIRKMLDEGYTEDEISAALEGVMLESKETPSEEDSEEELSEELTTFIDGCLEEGYTPEEIEEAISKIVTGDEKDTDDDDDDDAKDKDDEDDEDKEDKEDKEDNKKKVPFFAKKIDMSEHVDALLEGEDLSEDFRAKATTIFESAVNERVEQEIETLEEAYAASIEEEVNKIEESLTAQVSGYLEYILEQWVSDNEIAIESGLRTEITEDFLTGLRNLLAENNIDVPEEKVSVVEEMGSKIEELQARINEEIETNIELKKHLNESIKTEVLMGLCEGLTSTEADRLRALSENIGSCDPEEYETKVSVLRESYFPNILVSSKALDKADTDRPMITEMTEGRMGAYVKSIGKTIKQ